MMACDICEAKGTILTDLKDSYKTSEVQQVCPACEKVLNDQLNKIRSVTSRIMVSWLHNFIDTMKGKNTR